MAGRPLQKGQKVDEKIFFEHLKGGMEWQNLCLNSAMLEAINGNSYIIFLEYRAHVILFALIKTCFFYKSFHCHNVYSNQTDE